MPHPAVCRSLIVILLLAGCASRVPATGFAEPQAIERLIERYYERNASEENRTWLTDVTVVEEQPDRLVLDVRYFYRDRFKDDRSNGVGSECTGYAERQFTLAKTDAGLQVVAMTDSRR